jgi:hypothetical protein
MNSKTSTEMPAAAVDMGLRPWHLYVLLSMIAATAAVIVSRHTHPVALLVLSAAVMAAGLAGLAIHRALAGFAGAEVDAPTAVGDRERDAMLRDKALVLRSIKELEFDRATGKVGDADFKDMNQRLRTHAMALMEALERQDQPTPAPVARPMVPAAASAICPSCRTTNDDDATFCKRCGHRLGKR